MGQSDISALTGREFYIQANKDKILADPADVAEFAVSVLLNTSNEIFSQTIWDMKDSSQKHLIYGLKLAKEIQGRQQNGLVIQQ